MKIVKKLFPMAFTLKVDRAALIVDIILHLFFSLVLYIIGDLMLNLGAFGYVLFVILRIGILYLLASLVLSILHYHNVIK